jgi:hypothetical protein
MLAVYKAITATGRLNYAGAHIHLPTNHNIEQWEQAAIGHHDTEVMQFLKYGFPVAYQGPIPTPATDNHFSAKQYMEHVEKYMSP